MNRHWRAFSTLVLTRPFVLVCVLLFHAVAVLLGLIVPSEKLWPLLLALMAIPTAMLFALATERLIKHSASARELCVPRHASTMRSAQLILLAVLAGAPIAYVCANDAPPLAAVAAMLASAAIGTILPRYGVFVIVVGLVGVVAIGKTDNWSWLALTSVHVAAFALATVQLYLWSRLPAQSEAQAGRQTAVLADASHEQADSDDGDTTVLTEESREAAGPSDASETNRGTGWTDSAFDGATLNRLKSVREKGISDKALGIGLGFGVGLQWRPFLIATAVSLVVLVVWHFIHGRQPQSGGYFFLVVCSILALHTRVAWIAEAWKRTPTEQGLLTLMPAWPTSRELKTRLIGTVLRSQIGAWLMWGTYSSIALATSWVHLDDVHFGAILLLAAMCGSLAAFWALLARRAVHDWHVSTIVIAICCILGVMLTRMLPFVRWAAHAGVALILATAAIALLVLLTRPLLFPVAIRIKADGQGR